MLYILLLLYILYQELKSIKKINILPLMGVTTVHVVK